MKIMVNYTIIIHTLLSNIYETMLSGQNRPGVTPNIQNYIIANPIKFEANTNIPILQTL